MNEKPSPTFAKHLAAIRAGVVTRTNIIGIRKLINGAERRSRGWSVGMSTPLATLDQAWEIEEAIGEHLPRIEGELHAGGLAVLRNKRHAKRLAEVAGMIADIDHFCLARFDRINSSGTHSVPVYRAATKGGGYFTFRNVPWQSGGNGPELVAELD